MQKYTRSDASRMEADSHALSPIQGRPTLVEDYRFRPVAADVPTSSMRESSSIAVASRDEFFLLSLEVIIKSCLSPKRVEKLVQFTEIANHLDEGADVKLVVLDVDEFGDDLMSRVFNFRMRFPEVRVLLCTRSSRRIDILRAIEMGVHAYVPKEQGIGGLCEALMALDRGGTYFPPCLADIAREPIFLMKERLSAAASAGEHVLRMGLTRRQAEILDLITQGKSNKEIARILSIAVGTVKFHISALLCKLDVPNRTAASASGARIGPRLM